MIDATAHRLEFLLLAVLTPVWMLAGLADWACHRVQRIERSSGTGEAVLHLLMVCELALGIAAALLLDTTAGLLLLLLACCVAHELTTWWDLRYADARRRIPPYEQWVHAIQFAAPWTGLAALMVVHSGQALALVGAGAEPADWAWRLRSPPLPAPVLLAVFAGGALFAVLPFAQELYRCLRAARQRTPVS